MSAPSLVAGPHAVPPLAFGNGRPRRPFAPRTANEYPESLDAVGRLALSLPDLCRSAVDPLAIVAGLEAEGYNDRAAREAFDMPDLFALAEELHHRVPRDLQPPENQDPKPTEPARTLVRGLLFTAPALYGVTFLLSEPNGTGRTALACLQILAWGYGQGIAHLAYTHLNAGDPACARWVLRGGTVHALLAAACLFGAIDVCFGTPARALAPAVTTLGFCLAAVPALVLGAEFRLAATLVPAAMGAAAVSLDAPPTVALAAAAGSTALAILLAVRLTGNTSGTAFRVTAKDLCDTAPHILSGLGTGALLTLVLAGPAARPGLAARHAAMVLTISMGAGEWHARWYQRRVNALLAMLADPGDFPRRATGLLLAALALQTGTTAVLAAAGYTAFDQGDPSAAGLYFFAVALAPGLLAALFLRGIEATAVLWPTALTLTATVLALPGRNTAVLAALALESTLLLAGRAAAATARPWVHW